MGPPFVGNIEARFHRRVQSTESSHHGNWRPKEVAVARKSRTNLTARLVLFAALGIAGLSNTATAPAASFRSASYRISIAASYSGQGPTKISCLRDVANTDDGTT